MTLDIELTVHTSKAINLSKEYIIPAGLEQDCVEKNITDVSGRGA